jgi:predicted nucleic acid-binding protein
LSELVVIDSSYVIALERAEGNYQDIKELDILLPTPVIAEILSGVKLLTNQSKADRASEKLEKIQSVMTVVDFDSKAAEAFATLQTSSENRPSPRTVFDLMIAAISVAHKAQLLTLDKRANWEELSGVKLHPLSHKLH